MELSCVALWGCLLIDCCWLLPVLFSVLSVCHQSSPCGGLNILGPWKVTLLGSVDLLE